MEEGDPRDYFPLLPHEQIHWCLQREQFPPCREGSRALKPKAGRGRVLSADWNDIWGRQCSTSFNTAKFHAQQELGLKIDQDANEGLAHTVCMTRQ